jgi:hypothetical protein
MKKNIWRAVIEVGFIIFLFYANLLMGEFERSGMGEKRGVAWALGDVFTAANFGIAMIAANFMCVNRVNGNRDKAARAKGRGSNVCRPSLSVVSSYLRHRASQVARLVGDWPHEETRIDRRGLAWAKGRNGSCQSSFRQMLSVPGDHLRRKGRG